MQLQTVFLPWISANSLPNAHCSSLLNLSTNWDILGPFQIGTREAEWGADPLERLGGFRNLTYDGSSMFRSSLPINGTAQWSQTQISSQELSFKSTKGVITVGFDNTDWDSLRSVYGWSGTQFQAWARGSLDICDDTGNESKVTVILHVSNVGEFWVDNEHYFGGDFYGYHRAPIVLHLAPGKHKLDVRVTHDIRNFGGMMPPRISFEVYASATTGMLVAIPDSIVVSDLVEGKLVGELASIPLRNDARSWIEILEVAGNDNATEITFMDGDLPLKLGPGQTRPVRFRVKRLGLGQAALALKLRYRINGSTEDRWISVSRMLNKIAHWYLPQKYTFLHPSGIVSYAVIRPPSPDAHCTSTPSNKLPILLALHGAGVEAESPQSKEQYDALPDLCSWLLIPSGVTTWSGDDWHVWGFSDVEAGINAIPQWMESVGWKRQGVDLERWVISGHSNGGQGAWYGLTHRNDKIIAAAPLSGYLSIPAYVPYNMWHEVDPRKMAMVFASLNTYRNELLVGNIVGTPVLQQHGQGDDNVPVFHSRRMSQLVCESDWETEYLEIPGQGHWWEGVMTDGRLGSFLEYYLQEKPEIQTLPDTFSVVVASPADTGARGGIVVDQLEIPDQIGRIDVKVSGEFWDLKTSNIHRWHFEKPRPTETSLPSRVIVDDHVLALDVTQKSKHYGWFSISEDGDWSKTNDPSWKLRERSGRQMGALDAILGSRSRFSIVLPGKNNTSAYHYNVALEVSRNLFQYFAADSEIFVNNSAFAIGDGNLILLGFPGEIGVEIPHAGSDFPITKSGEAIVITDDRGRRHRYPLEPGMGIVYLYPLPKEQLALVIWGADEMGLRTAARLLPLRTGVGQPDFIVVGREMGWGGVGGTRAMGMFDYLWRIYNGVYL